MIGRVPVARTFACAPKDTEEKEEKIRISKEICGARDDSLLPMLTESKGRKRE